MVKKNLLLDIEIAYAMEEDQIIIPLRVIEGCSVNDVIHLSGILNRCPEIDLDINKIGIYSQQTTLATQVQENDRIEIYRCLQIDPKQARRKRVVKKKQKP